MQAANSSPTETLNIKSRRPIDHQPDVNPTAYRNAVMSWCLMSSDVIWHIRDKLWPMPKHGSIRKVYACLAVTCHLHFWQNDLDFLRATVVTRGWNGYRNKSQHRKSTLENKILPPFRNAVPRRSLLKYEMLRPLRLHMWRHSSVQLIPGFAATFKSASIFLPKIIINFWFWPLQRECGG